MTVGLPMTLIVNGKERKINADFRDVYEILLMFNDPEIRPQEQTFLMLQMLYKDDFMTFGDTEEAIKQAKWFIDCGKTYKTKATEEKVVDFEQDFDYIISAVDKNIKTAETCLELDFLHWWTFWAKLGERDKECQLSTIIGIREKLNKGKKLEKYEQEMLRENRDVIIIKNKIDIDDWWED